MKQIPSISDVASDLNNDGLTVNVEVNRQLAARYGITPATIDNALYDALGQRIVTTIFNQSTQYRVDPGGQARPPAEPAVARIALPADPDGQHRPGAAVGRRRHQGRQRRRWWSVTWRSFPRSRCRSTCAEGASLSTAVDDIDQAIQAVHLPPSITATFQGAAQAFEDSLSSEVFLLIAALVAVYIVLGVLYESFIHPVTILSTLPSAGIGALLALMLAGKDLDVIGIIGIVLLIGIVKKNAIMIVDFALDAEREHGKSPEEAIFEASLLRFRPILMTTLRRDAGRAADAAGQRHGLRAAPAARPGDHRRPRA